MTIYLRAYAKAANAFLDSLMADANQRLRFADYGVQLVLKLPEAEIATLPSFLAKAAALGVPVIPGFRLFEWSSPPAGGWLNVERWHRNAAFLRALCAALARPAPVIALDVEAYVQPEWPALAVPSREAFAAAAEPFLRAVAATGCVPCIQRADLDDAPTRPIVDAARGAVELWTEVEFGLSEKARLDHDASDVAEKAALKLARLRTSFAQVWPHAVVRHGAYEDLMKAWSAGVTADYGPHAPWVFLADRTGEERTGSLEWTTGLVRSTTNDVRDCWVVPPVVASITSLPGGRPLLVQPCPGSELGGYRAGDVLPRTGDFAAALGVTLPAAGDGPVMGASKDNHASWQLDLVGDRLLFRLRQLDGFIASFAGSAPAPRGKRARVVVSCTGGRWACSHVPDLPLLPLLQSGHLYLRCGVPLAAPMPKPWRALDGALVDGAEVWRRGLTATEISAVEAKAYPR